MSSRTVPDDRELTSSELLQRVVELCHERKAEDVVVLDVRELVEYMDSMVVCTGRSPRQNRAIAEHVMTQLKREHRVLPLSKAGNDAGAWICVDFVDVVLHVFEPEARGHYDLELLWADAGRTEHAAPVEEEAPVDEA
ncbi:MAG: ribosome silencing factor [Planctomycetota bacterium]|nr:ribosome silencing factor [Planctomycetota bacterium]